MPSREGRKPLVGAVLDDKHCSSEHLESKMVVSRGFGGFLARFALSVDIVNEPTFSDVKDLIIGYVRNELKVEYFEVMVAPKGNLGVLQTLWCSKSDRSGTTKSIRADGAYTDQTSYAFGEGARLWIVSGKDRKALGQAEEFNDMWSHKSDLPAYASPIDTLAAKTSIAVPLKDGDLRIGVMYLESPVYLELTAVAQKELNLLAEAVAMLYIDRARTKTTTEATQSAIGELRQILQEGDFPRLTKPKVFVAYPGNSDSEVVAVIQQVLNLRGDKIEPVFWEDVSEAGIVTTQIQEEIKNSAFGVCYLSEEIELGKDYVDNPNVLFEAGMMHAMSGTMDWILIRESQDLTGPAPFDLQPLRHIIVQRSADGGGRVQKAVLTTDFEHCVDALLDES
jgi:hypothetical protein